MEHLFVYFVLGSVFLWVMFTLDKMEGVNILTKLEKWVLIIFYIGLGAVLLL